MADEEENNTEDNAEGEQSEGGRRRWLLWGAGALLLVVAAVAVTLWFLTRDPQETPEAEPPPAQEDNVEQAETQPAQYFPLKPAIVVNFESQGRVRFLQASVTVMARDPEVIAGVKQHLPLIRNRLVLMFGGEVYEELQSAEGRELLRQKARQAIDDILRQEIGKEGVEQVLFTNFVMQ